MRCEVVPGSPRLIVSSPSALPFPGVGDGDQPARGATGSDGHDDGEPLPIVLERIREQARKPGRYRLAASAGRQWTVDADAMALAGFPTVGAHLPPETIAILDAASLAVAAFDRALGMLARARRTRRELTLRLRQRKVDAQSIERALERLEALGLLDDAAVARAEAAARFRRGEGERRIRQALGAKGVERSIAEHAIRDVVEEEAIDPRQQCEAAAEKRFRALRSYPPEVQRRRLMGFLVRRGFDISLVRDVVDATCRGLEHEPEWD